MIKKIWNWLIKSSADPEKFSRTLKSLLVAIAPTLVLLLTHFLGFEITQENILFLIGQITEFVGGVLTLFYLGAKIFNTVASWKQPDIVP